MTTIIEKSETLQDVLELKASSVKGADGTYYFYMPYWIESVPGTSYFKLHHLDDLPQELKDILFKARGEL